MKDMSYRPYIMWVFNDSDDDENGPLPLVLKKNDYDNIGKYYGMRWCAGYGTTEFRMFDMAPNWEVQHLHLKYVDTYIRWIKKNPPSELSPTLKNNATSLIQHFKEHILELGLSWDDYSRFTKNIRDRFRNSHLYDKKYTAIPFAYCVGKEVNKRQTIKIQIDRYLATAEINNSLADRASTRMSLRTVTNYYTSYTNTDGTCSGGWLSD